MLIKNIQHWFTRSHGDVHYQLTQFLAEHGEYRRYLHHFGHDNSPFSSECINEYEDPKHILFACPRFANEKEQLQLLLTRGLQIETIIPQMFRSQEVYSAVFRRSFEG